MLNSMASSTAKMMLKSGESQSHTHTDTAKEDGKQNDEKKKK